MSSFASQSVVSFASARLWSIVFLIGSLGTAAPLVAQSPEVEVSLARQQIFEGESVTYRVLLNHCDADTAPDLSSIERDFDVKWEGRTLIQQTSIVYRGAVAERIELRGPQYTYQLTPKRTGELRIPAPTVTIDGKTYLGREVALTVTPARPQDLVRMGIRVEPTTVYPLQAFRVALELDVQSMPEPLDRREPLELTVGLADLSLPWVDDDKLPKGLEPKQSWDRWLGTYAARGNRPGDRRGPAAGVSVNGIEGRANNWDRLFSTDPFSGFPGDPLRSAADRRIPFRPEPEQVLQPTATGRKVDYWRYRFERSFTATRSGTFEFGPATIKGQFVDRVDTRGRPETVPVFAIAPPVSVTVNEPPLAGRPASYTGAIGHFRCGAEMNPTVAKVGDPLTLTVWLQGRGTLDQVAPPRLDQLPELADQFRIYEPTDESLGDQRRFVFALRPLTSEVTEFPAIPLSYFDADREEYVALTTAPIPLRIDPSATLAGDDIARATPPDPSDAGLLRANVSDAALVRDERIDPWPWALAIGTLSLLLVLTMVGRVALRYRRHAAAVPPAARAAADARQRLREALAEPSDVRRMANGTAAALIGLVAESTAPTNTGWTSAEAIAQLDALHAPPELRERFGNLLELCDRARFGAAADAPSIAADAEPLLEDLVTWLQTQERVP